MAGLFTRKKIRSSKSLAEKLKIARKRKEINLEEAERETKISMGYLFALEHSQYDKLPADVYVYGFLCRYAEFLGLEKEKILSQYREEKKIADSIRSIKKHPDQENKNLIKPKPSEKWLKTPRFFITPELVIGLCVTLLVAGLLGYIWFQVKSFAAAPPLELKNPEAEIVVSMDSITIEGETDSGANLCINDEPVAIQADGSFVQEVQLVEGVNTIEIIARNKANKETKKIIQVLSKE